MIGLEKALGAAIAGFKALGAAIAGFKALGAAIAGLSIVVLCAVLAACMTARRMTCTFDVETGWIHCVPTVEPIPAEPVPVIVTREAAK